MAKLFTVRSEAKNPDCPYTEHRLRKMIAEGSCPGVRVGNRFMVNHDALVEMVNSQCVANVRADTELRNNVVSL